MGGRMKKSQFKTALIVEVMDAPGMFRLTQDFIYFSEILGRDIVVPADYLTDFSSIPWFLQSIIQVNGKHRRAAVVHDYLCTHGEKEGTKQRQADHVFQEAMTVLDVRLTQRKVMFGMVRIYQSITGTFR